MADGTIIQVGSFTSTGANVSLTLPMGVDWVSTLNYTQAGTNTQYAATSTYWQLGMAANDGYIGYLATGAGGVISAGTCAVGVGAGAVPGYILLNTSNFAPSAPAALTGLTWVADTTMTVATGNSIGLVAGAIVQMYGITGGAQWGGVPFVVNSVVGTTNFVINACSNANKGTAPRNSASVAAAGKYQMLSNGSSYWYPETLVITDIDTTTTPGTAIVTTSVPHGLTVGQAVRLNIPTVSGLSSSYQLNGFLGQINAVGGLVYNVQTAATIPGTYTTFNMDISSVGAVTAFTYPQTANVPCTPPYVTPVGESTYPKLAAPWTSNALDDATVNTAYIGILLGGGLSSPGGSANDVIYWRAGKSFNT